MALLHGWPNVIQKAFFSENFVLLAVYNNEAVVKLSVTQTIFTFSPNFVLSDAPISQKLDISNYFY